MCDERIIHVQIEGILLLAWCHSTFKKMVSKWGEFVSLEKHDDQNRFSMNVIMISHNVSVLCELTFIDVFGIEYYV